MTMKFNYDKNYIIKYKLLREMLVYLLLFFYVLILLLSDVFKNSTIYIIILQSWYALFIIYVFYDLIKHFIRPYLIINESNFNLNMDKHAISKRFSFNEIKESFLILNPEKIFFGDTVHSTPSIALHMKSGKVRHVRFVCLSEEDQQKVIEIFREKVKLKD